MLTYPAPNPVAFYLFHWPVYWYGLMYLFGFLSAWILLVYRLQNHSYPPLCNREQLSDLFFYVALGIVIGGRIGYLLFYNQAAWKADPWLVFQTWKGGMSFHGGLLGALLAIWVSSKKMNKPLLALTDFIAPVVPIGLGIGRIGNFINGELWGRVTTMPWGMVFPSVDPLPRHPSQLYEAGLEGILLFSILWFYSRKSRMMGATSGLFALLYGILRSLSECFREPDVQIGYLAHGYLTEGQLLSFPLLLIGIILLYRAHRASHETIP